MKVRATAWHRRRRGTCQHRQASRNLSSTLVTFACRLHELLDQVDQGSQVVATDPIQIMEDVTVPRRDSDITAWVNVIYGCNERCTYCVVPNTRGQEQSRRPEHIKVGLR